MFFLAVVAVASVGRMRDHTQKKRLSHSLYPFTRSFFLSFAVQKFKRKGAAKAESPRNEKVAFFLLETVVCSFWTDGCLTVKYVELER